jgi:hypothetical protein
VILLAKAYREILSLEKASDEKLFRVEAEDAAPEMEKQRTIDKSVFEALRVPDDVRLLAEDFRDNRLPLDKGVSALKKLGKRPNVKELQAYGCTLRDELERFLLGEARPNVRLIASDDLICCELRLLSAGAQTSQTVDVLNATENPKARNLMRKLREQLSQRFSQWVYVDRSLRVFEKESDTVRVFKAPRLMDWTRTQALNDADAIIAEILADGEEPE